MTLREAGEMYVEQKNRMDKVSEDLKILYQILEKSQGSAGSFTTCIVRTDILKRVTSHLEDHLMHLKYVMDKEMK